MKKIALAALAAVSFQTVFAGGVVMAPQHQFDGGYIGIGAGVSSLFLKDSFTTTRSSGVGGQSNSNYFQNAAVLLTAQLGYGKTMTNNVYIGGEAAVLYPPLKTTYETNFATASGNILINGTNTIKRTSYPMYNVDAVLGYQMSEHAMPFIQGGFTFGKMTEKFRVARARTNIVSNANVNYESNFTVGEYDTGYNFGLGMRVADHHWMASTVLLYSYLGSNTNAASVTIPGTTTVETQSRTEKNYALSLYGTVSYLFSV